MMVCSNLRRCRLTPHHEDLGVVAEQAVEGVGKGVATAVLNSAIVTIMTRLADLRRCRLTPQGEHFGVVAAQAVEGVGQGGAAAVCDGDIVTITMHVLLCRCRLTPQG